jgi:hypothetical protein
MRYLFTLLTVLLSLSICSQEQRKLALVIGNANYEDPNAVLLNPINDSRLMTETFKELEFDSVIVANDLTFDAMREVFKNYRNSLNRFDVGFIYYSGHGMQDAYNETYLIPIDFPENSTIDDVTDYGYSIQDVLKSLNRYGDKLNVFVLDACRDNPYERGWKGRSLKGGGLSEPKVPPTGSLVAYSTSPGDVASDGDVGSTNSIYTKALAEILKEPNLKIEEVFKRVRNVVYSGSNQTQNPQWWGQLEGDLYLLLKKDYNKIEVSELNNEAKKDVESGAINAAIKKYQILQNYFESSMNNIDKNKLLLVYMDLGNIYWSMMDSVSTNEEYESLQLKSVNSFFNAKQLLEAEGVYSKEEKNIYSSCLFKYLRIKSYIDFAKNEYELDNEELIKSYRDETSKLIQFNIDNFGELDIRTACAYYLKGILVKGDDPFLSFDALSKSSHIFSSINYSKEMISDYAFIDNIDQFACKWSIMVLNDILSQAWNSIGTDNDISHYIYIIAENDLNSFRTNQGEIIKKGIAFSKENDYFDYKGMLMSAERFYDVFSLFAIESEDTAYTSENCIDDNLESLLYGDTIMLYNSRVGENSYFDSIMFFNNYARKFNNISYLSPPYGKYEGEFSKFNSRVFQNYVAAFTIAANHQDPIWEIYSATPILEKYYYASPTDSLYTIDFVNTILNRIGKSINDLMYEYEDDNKSYVSAYFEIIDYIYYDKRKISTEEFFKIKKQHINSIFITDGYGSKNEVGALLQASTLLNDMERFDEAKQMKKDALLYINKHSSTWSIDEGDTGFNEIEDYIRFKKARIYSNYMSDIHNDYMDEYPQEDFKLLNEAEKFIEVEKEKLLETFEYFSLKLNITKARIYLNWKQDEEFIKLCDEALNILKDLKNDQNFSDISLRDIEDLQLDFHNYKISKHNNIDDYIENNYELIKTAKNWEERQSIFEIIDAYLSIAYDERWRNLDYKSYELAAITAFDQGEEFLEIGDFSYWKYPENIQKRLMLEMRRSLVYLTEHILNPSPQVRQKAIYFCEDLVEFIYLNKDKDFVYDADELYDIYNTISDQHHWLNNHDEAQKYSLKNLSLVRSDTIAFPYDSELQMLRWITEKYARDFENDSLALKYYEEYIQTNDFLPDSLDYSCYILEKQYGDCSIPFIKINLHLHKDIMPCLEFDLDRNNMISDLDKRYYVRSDTMVVEKISDITYDIGGYIYPGVDETGLEHDTSSYIFFEKENRLTSNSYVVKKQSKINEGYNSWEFFIPKHELIVDDSDEIRFIVNMISKNQDQYTLSRQYIKDTFPLASKFNFFESTFSFIAP